LSWKCCFSVESGRFEVEFMSVAFFVEGCWFVCFYHFLKLKLLFFRWKWAVGSWVEFSYFFRGRLLICVYIVSWNWCFQLKVGWNGFISSVFRGGGCW
jgi:hypothetical protein